jgi:hypothetical protein
VKRRPNSARAIPQPAGNAGCPSAR